MAIMVTSSALVQNPIINSAGDNGDFVSEQNPIINSAGDNGDFVSEQNPIINSAGDNGDFVRVQNPIPAIGEIRRGRLDQHSSD